MNKAIKSLMVCSSVLLLSLLTFPVFANQSQPIQSRIYPANPSQVSDNTIYIPLVFVPPPFPYTPQFSPIVNAENGSFTLNWVETPKQNSTTYRVQEATDSDFTHNLSEVCNTDQLYCAISNKLAGTYYYRVMGSNSWGSSSWSNVQEAVVLLPEPPVLALINNADADNLYTVNWNIAARATSYVLQESTDPAFGSNVIEYSTSDTSWVTPVPGKIPSTYYYRLKAKGATGDSGWSSPQSITIHPLYVGLKIRWDGSGYIRGSEYYDIGFHSTWNVSALTDVDTIRLDGHDWYDPDPLSSGSSTWTSYLSPSTGVFKSSTIPDDPSWKWGDGWRLAYNAQYVSGNTVLIDGQKFTVTGPIDGYTTFGKSIKYWQFVNQQKILIWDGGGDWKQYAHAGDITLRYDAGSSGLMLYENILRREYYKGVLTSDTVQYINQLTSSTSISGSPAFAPSTLKMMNSDQVNNLDRYQTDKKHILK